MSISAIDVIARRVHFAAQTGHGSFEKIGSVLRGKFHLVRDAVKLPYGNGTSSVETIRYSYRMDATI